MENESDEAVERILCVDSRDTSAEIDTNNIDRVSFEFKSVNCVAKKSYQERKLMHKLSRYEAMLLECEGIRRVQGLSQFLFVANCGVENNISRDFLESVFAAHGKLIDVVMPRHKSYAFVVFEEMTALERAVRALQAQVITTNQTPIRFYMFAVDRVADNAFAAANAGRSPPLTGAMDLIKDLDEWPKGLIYKPNYIDQDYADKIVRFLQCDDAASDANQQPVTLDDATSEPTTSSSSISNSTVVELKRRRVKHYGYDFRYGTNDCDASAPSRKPMPTVLLAELFASLIRDGLVSEPPDQLTVNVYEPGAGIGPHVDNVNAFGAYIISLSLLAPVVMRLRSDADAARCVDVDLAANSLLVLTGEARYRWLHSIAERKHDLVRGDTSCAITSAEHYCVIRKRQTRISLTFRKLVRQTLTPTPLTSSVA